MMKKEKSQKKVNRQILRRFAAEITRVTNYPISQDTVNQAIEAVEPELEKEGGDGEEGKTKEAEAG